VAPQDLLGRAFSEVPEDDDAVAVAAECGFGIGGDGKGEHGGIVPVQAVEGAVGEAIPDENAAVPVGAEKDALVGGEGEGEHQGLVPGVAAEGGRRHAVGLPESEVGTQVGAGQGVFDTVGAVVAVFGIGEAPEEEAGVALGHETLCVATVGLDVGGLGLELGFFGGLTAGFGIVARGGDVEEGGGDNAEDGDGGDATEYAGAGVALDKFSRAVDGGGRMGADRAIGKKGVDIACELRNGLEAMFFLLGESFKEDGAEVAGNGAVEGAGRNGWGFANSGDNLADSAGELVGVNNGQQAGVPRNSSARLTSMDASLMALPSMTVASLPSGSVTSLARPKSRTWGRPAWLTRMLPGLRSR
jgi:hypothetical protein